MVCMPSFLTTCSTCATALTAEGCQCGLSNAASNVRSRASISVSILGKSIRPSQLMAKLMPADRSEEHTSELQSLMRISYAVFCLKKTKNTQPKETRDNKEER